jgi:hypothetical protein
MNYITLEYIGHLILAVGYLVMVVHQRESHSRLGFWARFTARSLGPTTPIRHADAVGLDPTVVSPAAKLIFGQFLSRFSHGMRQTFDEKRIL